MSFVPLREDFDESEEVENVNEFSNPSSTQGKQSSSEEQHSSGVTNTHMHLSHSDDQSKADERGKGKVTFRGSVTLNNSEEGQIDGNFNKRRSFETSDDPMETTEESYNDASSGGGSSSSSSNSSSSKIGDGENGRERYKLYVEMEELRAVTKLGRSYTTLNSPTSDAMPANSARRNSSVMAVTMGEDLEWSQKARWMKYEQQVREEGDKWDNMRVSTVRSRALMELRAGLLTGTVLFDIPAKTSHDIIEVLVDSLSLEYRLNDEQNASITNSLKLPHDHRHKKLNRQMVEWLEGMHEAGRISSFYEEYKRRGNSAVNADPSNILQSNPVVGGAYQNFDNVEMRSKQLERWEKERDCVLLEAAHIMVGGVDYLNHTVMGFVRFFQGVSLGDFTQAPLGVRFFFVILGPKRRLQDMLDIGRAMGIIMSTDSCLPSLHTVLDRNSLVNVVDTFMRNGTIIPGAHWDRLFIPPAAMQASLMSSPLALSPDAVPIPTALQARPATKAVLKRTGRVFGGLINDVKNRLPYLKSDYLDGLNSQTFAAVGFIFFVCYAAALTFGAVMGEKTGNQIGPLEMVVATGFCGIFFAIFSGQPMLILGGTGPSLIFTELLYNFCVEQNIEFLPFRFWIGFWVFVLCCILVAADASYLVVYVTRFTEEIFGLLISLIFIIQAFQSLGKIYDASPVGSNDPEHTNVAVVATIYVFSTTLLSFALKFFGRSSFLPPKIRMAISNFGMLIAIFVMVCVDTIWFRGKVNSTYLSIPKTLTPTCSDSVPSETLPLECGNFTRGWFVNPMGVREPLSISLQFLAIVPALLVTVLMFMEQQIAASITNRYKLVKPTGYHLDLLLMGVMVLACSLFGLPWVVAAAVRCMAHVNSLTVMSKTTAPGEASKVERIIETRVSGLLIHVLVPASILLASVLRLIPLPVLYGLFLYMGFSSMFGVQFVQRLALLITPASAHPDVPFVSNVATRRMNKFTAIQVACLGVLCGINYSPAALSFPIIVILLIPLRRYLLPKFFTQAELSFIDN